MVQRKRSNGEGTIWFNQSRNRWEARLVTGRTHDGKLVRRTFTGLTRKAVATKLAEAKATQDQGLIVPDRHRTIDEYCRWWLTEILPGEGLAPRSEEWYRQMLGRYVVPLVGTRTLTGPRALTPTDVEKMCATLDKDGYSHRVAEAARTALGKVLRSAQQQGLVARNVARLAKPPRNRGRAREVKAMAPTEIRALLDALDGGPWHPIVVVGALTGLRPAELLALHWPEIHLDQDPHVVVRHAMTYTEGTASLKAPKRDRSYRSVLRHSFASHLLEQGAPIHHVAELLGDSVSTVENTYSHVLRPKHELAKLASSLLGGAQ